MTKVSVSRADKNANRLSERQEECLRAYAADKRTLIGAVASDALDEEEPLLRLNDLRDFGCAGGTAHGLIYYADTHAFYDIYYEEIEAMRREGEFFDGPPRETDLKNWYAWAAYECVAGRLFDELDEGR